MKSEREGNKVVRSRLSEEKGGTKFPINSIIARLPSHLCPKNTVAFNVTNQTDFARIEITRKGYVKIKAASALLWPKGTIPWGDPDGTISKSLGGQPGPCTPDVKDHPQASGRAMNMVSLDGVRFPLDDTPMKVPLEAIPGGDWDALGDYLKKDEKKPNLMDGSIFTLANYKAKKNAGHIGMHFGNLRKFRVRGNITISFYIEVLEDSNKAMTLIYKDRDNEGAVYYENGKIKYICGKTLNVGSTERFDIESSTSIKKSNGRKFVAIVRDINTEKLYMYIDGKLDNTKGNVGRLFTVSQNELKVGTDSNVGDPLIGIRLTNINIFNRALDDDEILSLKNSYGLIGRDYSAPMASKVMDERPENTLERQQLLVDIARITPSNYNPLDNKKRVNIIKLGGIFKWKGDGYPRTDTDICRLPEEYRPNATLTFTVNGGDKGILIRIYDSGIIKYIGYELDIQIFPDDVLPDKNYTKVVSLDGIEFLTYKYN